MSWPGGSTTVPAGQQQTTVTGLTNGTAYTMRVAARNRVGLGPATAAAAVTPTSTLRAPSGVTATPNADGTISLSWPAQSRPGVQYTVTAAGRTVARTTGTSARAGGLTLGRTYRFTVTASNGTQSLSTTSGPVIPYTAPGAPLGLKATPGKGQIALSWGAAPSNGSRITGYTVSGTGTRTVAGTSTTFTGLQTGRSHTFTVQAVGTDPNGSGTRVTGAAVRISATATAPPTVHITDAYITDNQQDDTLVVTVQIDDGGATADCVLSALGKSFDEGTCDTGTHVYRESDLNIDPDTHLVVTISATNPAGTGRDDANVPSGAHGSNGNTARAIPPTRTRRRSR